MEKTEQLQSGLTTKSLAVILVLVVLMGLTQTYLYFATGIADFATYWNDDHRPGLLFKGIGWWFLMLIILTAVTGKVGLTRQESVVVLASSFLAGSEIGPMIAGVVMSVPFGAGDPGLANYVKYLPSWYGVPVAATDPWLRGGAVRWDLVAGPFMGWVLVIIIWTLFQYATGLIMRHTVVDVEKLPFPWAQPAGILLDNATKTGSEKPGLFNMKEPIMKRIWIGFIIGIVMYLIFIPRFFMPDFPAPIMPEYHCTSPVHPWLFDFRGAWVYTLPWVSFYLSAQPELIASTFFFPMDVLGTCTALYVFFIWILPPIVAPMGWQGRSSGGTPWWVGIPNGGSWCSYWYDLTELPGNILFAFFAGIVFYGLWRFIWGWRAFKETLMGLFGRKVPGEENEPLPVRQLWIFVIGLFVASVVMLAVGFEMGLGVALITIVWSMIYWYSNVRLAGEAGPTNYWAGGSEFAQVVPYMGYRFGVMEERTVGAASSMLFANNYVFGYLSPASFSGFGLAGFSIARGTNTRPRDIFIAQVLTIVIALPIIYFMSISSITALGWTVKFKGKPSWTGGWLSWFGGVAESRQAQIDWFEDPATGTWQPWAIGSVMFFVLMVARSLLVWWPLNPVAFLIFGLYNTIKFSPAILVTFLIKLGVLRIGGTPLYDRATHFCAGLIAGSLVGRVVLQVIGYGTGLPLVY